MALSALAAACWLMPSTAGGSRIHDPASLHPDAGLYGGERQRLGSADRAVVAAVIRLPPRPQTWCEIGGLAGVSPRRCPASTLVWASK